MNELEQESGAEKRKPESGDLQIIRAEHSTISNVVQKITHVYHRSQLEKLDDYLAKAVAAYEARMYQLIARPPDAPEHPYKFLYAFEIEDADIFFGRDKATEELYKTILKDRLTILHARSGIGKTSLLNAGLSPRMIQEGRLPVYARAYDDPIIAIKRVISPPSLGPWPELLLKLTLHEFLGLVGDHLSRQTAELVIILDQFEGFFIFWPERDQRQPLLDILADSYEDKAVPIRFILAIRKDYYSDLADFQKRIPTIFYNEYRLDAMTDEEAQVAITGPTTRIRKQVSYEQILLDTLLKDLTQGGIELPHLQIICTRLYEALPVGETVIRLAFYDEFGRAEGILSDYLNNVLEKLPGREGSIAKEILKELVSSEATKRVLSRQALATHIQGESQTLDNVLKYLVDARLLRRTMEGGRIKYEMAHEYLIEEIKKWIDLSDLAFKQVQELLIREIENWRVHGTLIPKERLKLILAQRSRFKRMDKDAQTCILHSVLHEGHQLDEWSGVFEDIESLLIIALSDPIEEVRIAAAMNLSSIWGLPDLINLFDKSINVRKRAIMTLGSLQDPRTIQPLVTALSDNAGEVRVAAVWALGEIGSADVVLPLIRALDDREKDVRKASAYVIGRLGDPRAVDSLISSIHDSEEDVCCAAIKALSEIGDIRAVEPIIYSLKSENKEIQRTAVEALGDLGSKAINKILELLLDEDEGVRRNATKALGHIWRSPGVVKLGDEDAEIRISATLELGNSGDLRDVQPLIASLKDKDEMVRQAAALALGKKRDPQAVQPLIVALNDESEETCMSAAWALGEIRDPRTIEPLISAIKGGRERLRGSAADALGKFGDNVVQILMAVLQENELNVRWAATRALSEVLNIPELSMLASQQSEQRQIAAQALGNTHDPRVVAPLIAALQDDEDGVCKAAAYALGKLGDANAIEPLIKILGSGKDFLRSTVADVLVEYYDIPWAPHLVRIWSRESEIREAAANALGDIGDLRAVDPLVEAILIGDSRVRFVAIKALGKLGSPQAVNPLMIAITDEDSIVRQAAADALVQIDNLGVAHHIANLRDQNSNVRLAAVRSIEEAGDSRAAGSLFVSLLDEDKRVRDAAIKVLNKFGDVIIPPLVSALHDDDNNIREEGVRALGEVRDPRVIDPLIIALKDRNYHVRHEAVRTLGRLKAQRAVNSLIESLWDEEQEVRIVAIEALENIGDSRAVEALVTILNEDDDVLRRVAARTLGTIGDPRSVKSLVGALTGFDTETQKQAAIALKKIGTTEALAALEQFYL